MTHKSLALCMLAGLFAGCSGINVVKNPGPDDAGIRYYRPKPYLMVTPADATGRMVKMKVLYLPDYSEEYAIQPKGKKPPQVQLEDGWNLVAVGGPAPPPKPEEPPPPAAPLDPNKVPEFVVAATNVPIGLYESVFDSCQGKKTLKGWRYVGMSPLGGGPAIGMDPSCARTAGNCGPRGPAMLGPDGQPLLGPDGQPLTPGSVPPASSISGPLYGLVFFNGVMTFRQLDEIANNMTCPQYLRTLPETVKPTAPPPTTETTPDTQKKPPSTEIKPATSSGSPSSPNPNPGGGLGYQVPLPYRGDVQVQRTEARVKIPPPRIWDASARP